MKVVAINDKSIRYQMFYKLKLLKRIDQLKNNKGFIHRSQAITYLLNFALDELKDN